MTEREKVDPSKIRAGSVYLHKGAMEDTLRVVTDRGEEIWFQSSKILNHNGPEERVTFAGTETTEHFTGEREHWTQERLISAYRRRLEIRVDDTEGVNEVVKKIERILKARYEEGFREI